MTTLGLRDLAFVGGLGGLVPSTVSDPDARAYIDLVGAADGNQALEQGVQNAINAFVAGCKADGIWTAIKASCILAGARTLAGALVPLKGTAPANFNMLSDNYDRKTGLKPPGSLDSNLEHTSLGRDNISMSVWLSESPTISASTFIGVGGGGIGATNIFGNSADGLFSARCQSGVFTSLSSPGFPVTGLTGVSRNSRNSFVFRRKSANLTIGVTSETPSASGNVIVFVFQCPRLAFYHIGDSLSLDLLDTRVTALINAYAAAIP